MADSTKITDEYVVNLKAEDETSGPVDAAVEALNSYTKAAGAAGEAVDGLGEKTKGGNIPITEASAAWERFARRNDEVTAAAYRLQSAQEQLARTTLQANAALAEGTTTQETVNNVLGKMQANVERLQQFLIEVRTATEGAKDAQLLWSGAMSLGNKMYDDMAANSEQYAAAMSKGAAETAVFGNSLDNMRARWDPLFAKQQQYQAALASLTSDFAKGGVPLERLGAAIDDLKTKFGQGQIGIDQIRAKYDPLIAENLRYQAAVKALGNEIDQGLLPKLSEQEAALASLVAAHEKATEAITGTQAAAASFQDKANTFAGVIPRSTPEQQQSRAADVGTTFDVSNYDAQRAAFDKSFAATQTLKAGMKDLQAVILNTNVDVDVAKARFVELADAFNSATTAAGPTADQLARIAKADADAATALSNLRSKYDEDYSATQKRNQSLRELQTVIEKTPISLAAATKAFNEITGAVTDSSAAADAARAKYDPLFEETQRYTAALKTLRDEITGGLLPSYELQSMALKKVIADHESNVEAITKEKATQDAASSTSAKAAADLAAYAKQQDEVRARFDPVFAATLRYKNAVADLNEAVRNGTIKGVDYDAALIRLSDSFNKNKTAAEGAASGHGQAAFAVRQLGVQTVQFFSSLESGQSVFTAFIQQGHQVIDVALSTGTGFGVIKDAAVSAFRAITSSTGLVVTAVVAVGVAIIGTGAAAEIAARQHLALQQSLRATRDDYVSMTAEAESAARAIARETPFSTADARAATGAIVAAPQFQGDTAQLVELTKQAGDLATMLGITLPEATKIFVTAMANPGQVADDMANRHLKTFDASLVENIKLMQQSGDTAGGFAKALEAMHAASAGATEQSLTPLQRSLDDLSKAFTKTGQDGRSMANSIGDAITGAATIVINSITGIVKALEWLRQQASTSGPLPGAGAGANPNSPVVNRNEALNPLATNKIFTIAEQQNYAQNATLAALQADFATQIAYAESKGQQFDAKGGVLTSAKGAMGMFQLEPGTASDLGVNASDETGNIQGGLKYINQLWQKYGGNTTLVAMAYNWGPGNVDAFLAGIKETKEGVRSAAPIPPPETQKFVADVTGQPIPPNLAGSQPNKDALTGRTSAETLAAAVSTASASGAIGSTGDTALKAWDAIQKLQAGLAELAKQNITSGHDVDTLNDALYKEQKAFVDATPEVIKLSGTLARTTDDNNRLISAYGRGAQAVADVTAEIKAEGDARLIAGDKTTQYYQLLPNFIKLEKELADNAGAGAAATNFDAVAKSLYDLNLQYKAFQTARDAASVTGDTDAVARYDKSLADLSVKMNNLIHPTEQATKALQDQGTVAKIIYEADQQRAAGQLAISRQRQQDPLHPISDADAAAQINAQLGILSAAYANSVEKTKIATTEQEKLTISWRGGAAAAADAATQQEAYTLVANKLGKSVADQGTAVAAYSIILKDNKRAVEENKAVQDSLATSQQIEIIKAEKGAILDNSDARALMVQHMKDQVDIESKLPDLTNQEKAALLAQKDALARNTQELQTLQQTANYLSQQFSSAFDTIGNAITQAFVQGSGSGVKFGNVMQGVFTQLIQQFAHLALINPILNSLFGGNATTLSSVFNLLGSAGSSTGSIGNAAANALQLVDLGNGQRGLALVGAGADGGGGGGFVDTGTFDLTGTQAVGAGRGVGGIADIPFDVSTGVAVQRAAASSGGGGASTLLSAGSGLLSIAKAIFPQTFSNLGETIGLTGQGGLLTGVGSSITSFLNTPIFASASGGFGAASTSAGIAGAEGADAGLGTIAAAETSSGALSSASLSGLTIGGAAGIAGGVIGGYFLGNTTGGLVQNALHKTGPAPQIGSALGAVGGAIGGFVIGGPAGAVIGGLLGGALGGAGGGLIGPHAPNAFSSTIVNVDQNGFLTVGGTTSQRVNASGERTDTINAAASLNDLLGSRGLRVTSLEGANTGAQYLQVGQNTPGGFQDPSKYSSLQAAFPSLRFSSSDDLTNRFIQGRMFASQDELGGVTTSLADFENALKGTKAEADTTGIAFRALSGAANTDVQPRLQEAATFITSTYPTLAVNPFKGSLQTAQEQVVAQYGPALAEARKLGFGESDLQAAADKLMAKNTKAATDATDQMAQSAMSRYLTAHATVTGSPQDALQSALYSSDINAAQQRTQISDNLKAIWGDAYETTQGYADRMAQVDKASAEERLAILTDYNRKQYQIMIASNLQLLDLQSRAGTGAAALSGDRGWIQAEQINTLNRTQFSEQTNFNTSEQQTFGDAFQQADPNYWQKWTLLVQAQSSEMQVLAKSLQRSNLEVAVSSQQQDWGFNVRQYNAEHALYYPSDPGAARAAKSVSDATEQQNLYLSLTSIYGDAYTATVDYANKMAALQKAQNEESLVLEQQLAQSKTQFDNANMQMWRGLSVRQVNADATATGNPFSLQWAATYSLQNQQASEMDNFKLGLRQAYGDAYTNTQEYWIKVGALVDTQTKETAALVAQQAAQSTQLSISYWSQAQGFLNRTEAAQGLSGGGTIAQTQQAQRNALARSQETETRSLPASLIALGYNPGEYWFNYQVDLQKQAQTAETAALEHQIAMSNRQTALTSQQQNAGFDTRYENAAAQVSGGIAAQNKASLDALDAQAQAEMDNLKLSLVQTYGDAYATSQDYADKLTALQKAQGEERLSLQKQQDDQLKSQATASISALNQYAMSLQTSSESPLSPQGKFDLAKTQFDTQSGLAASGNYAAVQTLQTYATNYLDAAHTLYGSGTDYVTAFGRVITALATVGGQTPDALTASVLQTETRSQTAQLVEQLQELQDEVKQLRLQLTQGTSAPARVS